jgi:hypothetical protein
MKGKSMKTRFRTLFFAGLAVLSTTAIGFGASQANFPQGLLAAGVGSAGNWDSEVELANPYAESMIVFLSEFPSNDFNTGCDFGCNMLAVGLPAHGSRQLKIDGGIINPENEPGVAAFASGHIFTLFISRYVTSTDFHPERLPIAHVHAINRVTGRQSEVPVITIAAAAARPVPSTLVFPGVVRSENAHCNLILSTVSATTDDLGFGNVETVGLSGTLSLNDADGNLLASRSVPVGACLFPGKFCANTFIVDVTSFLGIGAIESGSISVTQNGAGVLWGEMPCITPSGEVVVHTGYNP